MESVSQAHMYLSAELHLLIHVVTGLNKCNAAGMHMLCIFIFMSCIQVVL